MATARLAFISQGLGLIEWSPDSRYVYFVGLLEPEESEGQHLMRLSVEDGSLRSFPAISPSVAGPFTGLIVSSDDEHIGVVAGEPRQEIWRMTFNDRD